jgi:hypothetical protein
MTTADFANKFEWVRALDDPSSGLTSTQHHVALALSGHLNAKGTGFVTHAQLAIETRMSERTVCAALTALADAHWIERTPGKMGHATDYRIARKFGWTPTSKEDRPKRPRRKRRRPADPDGETKARALLSGIYATTGIDVERANDDTPVTRRLIGVLRRHLNSDAADGSGTTKIINVLTETSLGTAHDPAAVLLTRYKKAMRMYPHLQPVSNAEQPLDDVVARLASTLADPARIKLRPETGDGGTPV